MLRKIWDASLRAYCGHRSDGGVGSVILSLEADDGDNPGRPIRLILDEGTLIALLQIANNAQ
jgi:hypothetical protein